MEKVLLLIINYSGVLSMIRDTVKASDNGIEKLQKAYKDLKFRSWEEVAEQTGVHIDTIKRLRGAKDVKNGERASVERSAVEKIAKVLNLQPSDIVDNWYPVTIPTEFITVIADKTQIFCGRKFVFNAINQFIKDHKSVYFTILGDAGMGKSAIAAKYIVDHPGTICFFNIRAEGRNRPDVFLRLIRQQLSQRFDIANVENDDLSTLLTKASQKLSDYEKLVIVIDALDEVDQDDHGNLLNLPMYLPEKVYLILTRRPYNSDNKRLTLSPDTKYQELDLREYQDKSNDDVKACILEFLGLEKYKAGLETWIKQQNDLSKPKFVDTIAAKSENNFMYLRYLLEAIANGFYQDEKLEQLPAGLQGYYESHWRIMGMTKKPLPKDKIKIIYAICFAKTAISDDLIAKHSKQSNLKVQEVIRDWTQFLQIQKQENNQPYLYRFYHESFRDFLQKQDIVKAAGVTLSEVKKEISDNISEGLYD
jgi:hypothetical protein